LIHCFPLAVDWHGIEEEPESVAFQHLPRKSEKKRMAEEKFAVDDPAEAKDA
jgi:hypothetical protein